MTGLREQIAKATRKVAAQCVFGNDTTNTLCSSAACKNASHGSPQHTCDVCRIEALIEAHVREAQAKGKLPTAQQLGSEPLEPTELEVATHILGCGHPANAQSGDEYGHPRCDWCHDVREAQAVAIRAAADIPGYDVNQHDFMLGPDKTPEGMWKNKHAILALADQNLVAELERKARLECICTYCGKIQQRIAFTGAARTETIAAHLKECPNHPLNRLIDIKLALDSDLDWEARETAIRRALARTEGT